MAIQSTAFRFAVSTLILSIVTAGAHVALGQYTFVEDTVASNTWTSVARWHDGGSNTTFPNAVGATVLMTSPTSTTTAGMNPAYQLSIPAPDITVGEFTIDNSAFADTFKTNMTNGGGHFIWENTAGNPAKFTETPSNRTTATPQNVQNQFSSIMDVHSNWLITQNNYADLNTGTIFTNLMNAASNITITKEGYGGIQFNYGIGLGVNDQGFQGKFVINNGGIRLIGPTNISVSTGIIVNSGGQLQLADNGGTQNPTWTLAPGAALTLNGAGKAQPPSGLQATNTEGALRIGIQSGRSTEFQSAVVLQTDSVISIPASSTTFGTLSGVVSGPGGLIKQGPGTLILNNSNDGWGGDTKMLSGGGTLSLSNAILPNGRDVYLVSTPTPATLDLNFNATDDIRTLYLDGTPVTETGLYGAMGNSNVPANHQTALITGIGILNVTALPGVAGDFNGDGKVDAADYVSLRKQNADITTGAGLTAYNTWYTNFGAGNASLESVPEPGAVALMVFGLLSCVAVSRRHRLG